MRAREKVSIVGHKRQSSGRNFSSRWRTNSSARSGLGSGEDFRIAFSTALS